MMHAVPLLASLLATQPSVTSGELTIPLQDYQQIARQIDALKTPKKPEIGYALQKRTIDGKFFRGVLRGQIRTRVEVFAADTWVPIVSGVSLADVRLDGAAAVAVLRRGEFAVQISKPGVHELDVSFTLGREEARFVRAFRLRLPDAPFSRVTLTLPERDVDVELAQGVVFNAKQSGAQTIVKGAFSGNRGLDVRWRPRISHGRDRSVEFDVNALALVRVDEEVVQTETELNYRLLSGETDRVEATVPAGVEVRGVRGDAVLQWYTESGEGDKKRLVVLLRHLVSDRVALLVQSQAPLDERSSTKLAFIEAGSGPMREALFAVEGRAGFELTVTEVVGGKEVGARELPERLRSMSDKPLLFAYRAEKKWPQVELSIVRNAEIDLTQAVIDDMQVSTVLVGQGTEITKMRLMVRNNTRQYLRMRLPKSAVVTHALIDGTAFRPAYEVVDARERLLIPLRQSERLSNGQRRHVVQNGETLGEISLRYLGTFDRWQQLVDYNPTLRNGDGLIEGEVLQVPSRSDVQFEESNFVVELAYKVERGRLGLFGRHRAELPELDIPVMAATWHYYFPESHDAISIATNLRQLDWVRYDPVRRVRFLLQDAFSIQSAWAGSGIGYSNILSKRKRIYRKEQKQRVNEALASFPLVGRRHRFDRVLLGSEEAFLEFTHVDRAIVPWLRGLAFLTAVLMMLFAARALSQKSVSRPLVFGLTAAGLVVLLYAGHYVLGVNRRVLQGLDAGLLLVLLPAALLSVKARLLRWVEVPANFGEVLRWRTLLKVFVGASIAAIILALPMLMSSICFVLLAIAFYFTKGRRHA